MYTYTAKKFSLPALSGLSEKQVAAHIGLYEGYVKHVNLIAERLSAVRSGELTLDPYIVSELRRRFAFEFDGMRMHEYYFTQLEGGVVVYYDAVASSMHTVFVADHELGQLSGLPIVFALDLWEHAFMVDYLPAEKKQYIDAFLQNINWKVVEERFATL